MLQTCLHRVFIEHGYHPLLVEYECVEWREMILYVIYDSEGIAGKLEG